MGKKYLYGLILTPYLGWSAGTLLGAAAGNILPQSVISALGIAIYAMFAAIVIPAGKKDRPTALCAAAAVVMSCIFAFVPALKKIPGGFTIIICAAAASALFAVIAPVHITEDEHE